MKTKSQTFAEIVMPNVLNVVNSSAVDVQKQYKSLAKKAGSLVRNSGLMQTLAFFRARGKEHHLALLTHLEQELRALGLLTGNNQLYDIVLNANVPTYMVLTREVLLLLNWHKRLVETLIITDQEENQQEQEEIE